MTNLVDVVNFNADASCLECARWLAALRGGYDSEFCDWLRLYINRDKKIVLGLTGATIADVHTHNPESLELIRANPDVFGMVVRPFSHDAALVREPIGYELNLRLGLQAMERAFARRSTNFLPPEFMLLNEQIGVLVANGISSLFLNPARFPHETRERIPDNPYRVNGVDGSVLRCIPMIGEATQSYLDSLHRFEATPWNNFLAIQNSVVIVTWRDGESPFLIPDGIARETAWLDGEQGVDRTLLDETEFVGEEEHPLQPHHLRAYPVHSLQAWMKGFRMIGYLSRLQRLESQIADFSYLELILWLQAINSDVLSAVEKRSPLIHLRESATSEKEMPFTIWRSERGFEGESYLHALEAARAGNSSPADRLLAKDAAFAEKLRGRLGFIQQGNAP
jgi:hypothetical protein